MRPKYSIIIPAFNEELFLEDSLESLKKFENYEVIISDGGSSDDTLKIAEKFNAKIVNSKPGRGIQLNKGIDAANGEILCFLHADTALPDNAFELLEEFFQDIENKICRFKLGFDVDHKLLNRYKRFSKYDTPFTRFGDMFIAVRKNFTGKIGGYPNWKVFEDVEFLRKAARLSKVNVLNAEVISSARTFTKHGLIAQQLFNISSFVKFFLGNKRITNESKYYDREMKKISASIILFVKYPVEGKVKTRLGETTGNKKAAEIYSLLAENIIGNVKRLKNTYNYIFYSDDSEKDKIKSWIKGSCFYAPQKGNGLGERMSNAFKLVFGHGAKKALIIGTDIPNLSTEIIEQAITKLDEFDIVIGPSPDGGYYLLGMKKFIPGLFKDITYSTSSVFVETIRKTEDMNLTHYILDEKADIDTEKELKNWLQNSQSNILKQKINAVYSQNI